MARFDRNVLRPRSPCLRPQQVLQVLVLVLVLVLAGMVGRTGANVGCACNNDSSGKCKYYALAEKDGKCPVPEMNAAFGDKLSYCSNVQGWVSCVCACARCVRCAVVITIFKHCRIYIPWQLKLPAPRPD